MLFTSSSACSGEVGTGSPIRTCANQQSPSMARFRRNGTCSGQSASVTRPQSPERSLALSAKIQVGNTVIHRIVEQEAPFFPAFQFFPTLSKELYEENKAWLQPTYIDTSDRVLLCIQSYLVQTPHHN